MDASTRRTLALAAAFGFALASFGGGPHTVGLLSDRESAGVSMQVAGNVGGSAGNAPSDGVVTFRGCGEARLDRPPGESFTAAFVAYDASRGAREVVTLTADDAGSPASGFWYDSGLGAYRFDVRAFADSGDGAGRLLGVRLDGELVRNDRQCAPTADGGHPSDTGDERADDAATDLTERRESTSRRSGD